MSNVAAPPLIASGVRTRSSGGWWLSNDDDRPPGSSTVVSWRTLAFAAMPEISAAMEDYLKAIHQIGATSNGGAVTTQALADRLHVSTASVTGMIKKLDSLRLV